MTPLQRKLFKSIDEILWKDWDPLDLNGAVPKDEYQNYTPAIFKLKLMGADVDTIAHQLQEFEQNAMGLSHATGKAFKVATQIHALSTGE